MEASPYSLAFSPGGGGLAQNIMSMIRLTIPATETRTDDGGKPYTVYTIRVALFGETSGSDILVSSTSEQSSNSSWHVAKRFSQFEELHTALSAALSGLQAPLSDGPASRRPTSSGLGSLSNAADAALASSSMPAAAVSMLPELPAKGWLTFTPALATAPDVVESRRVGLESYLRSLQRLHFAWALDDLVRFLDGPAGQLASMVNATRLAASQRLITLVSVNNARKSAALERSLQSTQSEISELEARMSRMEAALGVKAPGPAGDAAGSPEHSPCAVTGGAVGRVGGGRNSASGGRGLPSLDDRYFGAQEGKVSSGSGVSDVRGGAVAATAATGASAPVESAPPVGQAAAAAGGDVPSGLQATARAYVSQHSNALQGRKDGEAAAAPATLPLDPSSVTDAGAAQLIDALLGPVSSDASSVPFPASAHSHRAVTGADITAWLASAVGDGGMAKGAYRTRPPRGVPSADETGASAHHDEGGFPLTGRALRSVARLLMPAPFHAAVGSDAGPEHAAAVLAGRLVSPLVSLVPPQQVAKRSAPPVHSSPALAAIEAAADAIASSLAPPSAASARVERVLALLRSLVCESVGGEAFLSGAAASGTLLCAGESPTEPLEVAVLLPGGAGSETEWHVRVTEALFSAAAGASSSGPSPSAAAAGTNAPLSVQSVSFLSLPVDIETSGPLTGPPRVIQCTIDGVPVRLALNSVRGIAAAAMVETADALIGRGHLFKRSLLLLKAALRYDSRTKGNTESSAPGGTSSAAASALLAGSAPNAPAPAATLPISDHALASMLLAAFNAPAAAGGRVATPLRALVLFLETYGSGDPLAFPAPCAAAPVPAPALRHLALFLASCVDKLALEAPALNASESSAAALLIDPLAHWANLCANVGNEGIAAFRASLTGLRGQVRALLAAACSPSAEPAAYAATLLRSVLPRTVALSGSSASSLLSSVAAAGSSTPHHSGGSCGLCPDAASLAAATTFGLAVCSRCHVTPVGVAVHSLRMLAHLGSLPVGFIGKALQDSLLGVTLPGALKEHVGGMKTFLDVHRGLFHIAQDHNFNPTVSVAPAALAEARRAAEAATASM